MNLSFHIAKRYLIAKKSHNAINIISVISMIGVAIGTMALIIVLGAFNGFENLLSDMYSDFNPEVKISSNKGRVFNGDSVAHAIKDIHEIEAFSQVLESQALIVYNGKQSPATLKGVDSSYNYVSSLDSSLARGTFSFDKQGYPASVMGFLLARTVGAGVHFVHPLELYVPKREGRISTFNPSNSFNKTPFFVNGIFLIGQPEIDEHYMLFPLDKTRKLLQYTNQSSAIELKVQPEANINEVKQILKQKLGANYSVKDRQEQEAALYKMMNIEKWMAFFILVFILVIAAFNSVGSLSMLMLDKKADMIILKNMGASTQMIKRIFLFEGWMISLGGAIIGLVIGIILCLTQMYFGFIKMGGGFVVDAYPMLLKLKDVFYVLLTVGALGFSIAFIPVHIIFKRFSSF